LNVSLSGVEYIHVPVVADVFLDMPVEMAFTGREGPSFNTAWVAASWVGDLAMTRTARLLVRGPGAEPTDGTPLPSGFYQCWIRLLDTPEVIVRKAGAVIVN
jgi:hypothetical protein